MQRADMETAMQQEWHHLFPGLCMPLLSTADMVALPLPAAMVDLRSSKVCNTEVVLPMDM